MGWMASIFIALLTAVASLVCAGLVASAYAQWYSVSSREGAAGFMVVGVALLGGLAGGVLGLTIARVLAAAGFWKAAGVSLGVVFAVSAVLTLAFYYFADIGPKIGDDDLRLEVEIKLPAGVGQPAGEGRFTLGSVISQRQRASEQGELLLDRARLEAGRWIVPARVYLFTTRGQRTIMAELGGKSIAGFLLPLPKRPTSAHEQWSDWGPRPPAGEPPWPDSKPSYRFRVQRMSGKFLEEEQAREEAEAQARFRALPADASLASLLAYAGSGKNEKRRVAAVQRLAKRPDLVLELGAMMRHADVHQAELAMQLLGQLREFPFDWVPSVQAAGKDIVARLRDFNAQAPGDTAGAESASGLARRYRAWISAVHEVTPHSKEHFLALVRDIAALSAVRSDSSVMQNSVHADAQRWVAIWSSTASGKEGQAPQ